MRKTDMRKKGYCIICHRDNQELSDEHVIPEAIGGCYHIYNVCKDCNSRLGDHVDKLLLNHWLIKAARYEKKLKGYKGHIPNPLLGEGNLSTGEKVRMEQDDDGKILEPIIDNSNTGRHILLLINFHNKLYCLVKLFDKFCQVIRMSDCSYGEEGLVWMAMNDFVKHRCDFYNPADLARAITYRSFTTFKLKDEDQAYLDAQKGKGGIGFACNKNHDHILYDCLGNPVCTESWLLQNLEESNFVKSESYTPGRIAVAYTIPWGYNYLCMPERKLLVVKEITQVYELRRI